MRFGRNRPTLTLITDGERRVYPDEAQHSANDVLMSRLLSAVMEEAMKDIFSVDLAHFVGELRNGYKDIIMDIVKDCLSSSPYGAYVNFSGKGTFELDWNTVPAVRLEFVWAGPFYEVIFEVERRGNEMQCYFGEVRPQGGQSAVKATKHFIEELQTGLQKNII